MPDYTVSGDVDSMLRSANDAAIRSAIGVGQTDVPVLSGVAGVTGGSVAPLLQTTTSSVFHTSLVGFPGQRHFSFGWAGAGGSLGGGASTTSTGAFAWTNSSTDSDAVRDLLLLRDAAGILAQRNGTAKQVHRVYNTFLGTTANEWGGFDWLTTANVLRIGTDHAGTGGARDLQIITNGIARLTIQGNGNASFTNTVGFGGNVNVGYLLGLASLLVSQLPAASGTAIFSLVGVSNSNVTAALGKGTTVVGGGSNKVIVMCDGTNWVIL